MKTKKTDVQKPYILIVEDEILFYRDMSDYLTEKGFTVAPYTKNYREAMQRFHERLPDAVLMDIDLGEELNGINVALRIREFSDVPLVFLSNLPTTDNIFEACKANADDFLVKTAIRSNEQIFTTLQLVLHKKKKLYPQYGIRVWTKFKTEYEKNSQSPTDLSKTIAENDIKKENLVKNNEKSIILPFQEIAYITTFKDIVEVNKNGNGDESSEKGKGFVAFHCLNGTMYYKYDTLKVLKKEKLPDYFLFCNQSYLVNAYAVGEINSTQKIKIANIEIPVSDRFREQFFRDLRKFYVE